MPVVGERPIRHQVAAAAAAAFLSPALCRCSFSFLPSFLLVICGFRRPGYYWAPRWLVVWDCLWVVWPGPLAEIRRAKRGPPLFLPPPLPLPLPLPSLPTFTPSSFSLYFFRRTLFSILIAP